MKATQAKLSRMLDMIEDGEAGPDVKDRLAARRAELNDLREREAFLETQACAGADAASVRAFLLSYRDNLASADPVAKRKTIETFVEKVIVFADRFDCHFRVDPVSDKVGGGEPCHRIALTIPRQVMPTRKSAPACARA